MKKTLLFILSMIMLYAAAHAADDTLINLRPERMRLSPGTIFYLPDGRRGTIQEILPGGQLKTDLGIILTPDGIVAEGPSQGAVIEFTPPVPETSAKTAPPEQPAQSAPATPEEVAEPQRAQERSPAILLPATPAQTAQQAPPAAPDHRYTIAELLPKTKVPETKPAEKPMEAKKAPNKKIEQPPKKDKQEKESRPSQSKKPEEKQPSRVEKPKNGQELSIPPDAAKKGDLSFLEGCWQGTRPEYYSKRTIRECFCFSKGGKSGKRRVIDPQGRRKCIGSTRATLSPSGVLSVTSSGAACDDGERWGQAEMICRNSGPRTPCSWVFRDANNGQQSYQIPFIRVESCGR